MNITTNLTYNSGDIIMDTKNVNSTSPINATSNVSQNKNTKETIKQDVINAQAQFILSDGHNILRKGIEEFITETKNNPTAYKKIKNQEYLVIKGSDGKTYNLCVVQINGSQRTQLIPPDNKTDCDTFITNTDKFLGVMDKFQEDNKEKNFQKVVDDKCNQFFKYHNIINEDEKRKFKDDLSNIGINIECSKSGGNWNISLVTGSSENLSGKYIDSTEGTISKLDNDLKVLTASILAEKNENKKQALTVHKKSLTCIQKMDEQMGKVESKINAIINTSLDTNISTLNLQKINIDIMYLKAVFIEKTKATIGDFDFLVLDDDSIQQYKKDAKTNLNPYVQESEKKYDSIHNSLKKLSISESSVDKEYFLNINNNSTKNKEHLGGMMINV